jgi:uncharacterized protein with NAD-binding domain and iron-sulfur cluster
LRVAETDQAVSRRSILKAGAAAAGAATLAGGVPLPAFAATPGKRVAVFGGGPAGLTVAHELIERGFSVTVYEPTAWGGKARSINVPNSAKGGRKPLPGEHGFRFFPGFYHHIPDSMRRIPFGDNENGVWDNLVAAQGGKFLRQDPHLDAFIFGIGPDPQAVLTLAGLRKYLLENLRGQNVPPDELVYFVERLLVFLTSSDERRMGQWENVAWWDFVGAGTRSADYQKVLAAGLTRNLVAAKETVASTRTIGTMGEAFVYNILGQGADGAIDRVLDLPTNEAWIYPWYGKLKSLGVKFVGGQGLARYEVSGGRIAAAWVQDRAGKRTRITADYYVSAMPAEQARKYLSADILKLDPSLSGLSRLKTDWMTGIQYFLRERIELTKGHITFIDSPWALTALTQAQFWSEVTFEKAYGDGSVKDCLSVDISNWDAPGVVYGKPAKRCSPREVATEVYTQIRRHKTFGDLLPSKLIHSWFLDPGIHWNAKLGRNTNDTPLLVNTVGSWKDRPTAATKVPNLFFAGDFVQTNIDLATMEGAGESGRAAANAILAAAGSSATPAQMFKLWKNPLLAPLQKTDGVLYKAGLPNALDIPLRGRF